MLQIIFNHLSLLSCNKAVFSRKFKQTMFQNCNTNTAERKIEEKIRKKLKERKKEKQKEKY